MNREYVDYVIDRYDIDFVVHGDDPCFVDGKDVYEAAKASGKFRTIPRTDGVSTTDIIGRMLLMTKDHHLHSPAGKKEKNGSNMKSNNGQCGTVEVVGNQSKFLTTSRMLQLFSAVVKAPPSKDMHVVYVEGSWDM
jgi:ethanolamine-phosphate cytidylyltransferase